MPPASSPNTSTRSQAGIQSVEVGFSLLDALSQAGGAMMLRDLAQAANMSPAKAHRYLVSFQKLGLARQEGSSTRYDLGPAALRLGLATLSRLNPVQLARAQMDELMAAIGHTVAIAVWGNRGPVIVHWQEPAGTITVNLRLGDVMPLLTSATGQCFAAFASSSLLNTLLKEEQIRSNSNSPQAKAAYQRILAQTRKQGLARVDGTLLPGIVGLAAPVWDSSAHMCLALLTLGSEASLGGQAGGAAASALKACAMRLSQQLGHAG